MKSIEIIDYQYVNGILEGFDEARISNWIKQVIRVEGKDVGILTFIFCDDEYLLVLNKEYLNHDYLTDVITFDYSDDIDGVSGDVFISITRVRDNADGLGIDSMNELYRVMLHGVLHLLGYTDKEVHEVQRMREKENYYLSLLS